MRREPGSVYSRRMLLDLHTHTYPASSCSHISYHDYIVACREKGLAAVALTNHGSMEDNRKLEGPLADEGVLLIHGVEISTMYGDFIVLSPDLDYLSTFKDVQGLPPEASIPDDAAVVWVHAAAGGGRSGSAYYPTLERHVAPIIDAIEIYNGNWLADRYVKTAERIATELGLARTGGSDAHEAQALMACATEFPDPVRSTADVVKALKEHRTSPWRREAKSRRRLGLFG